MEVVYIDHMGSDLRVVNAARVSFNKESEWDFIKHYNDDGDFAGLSHGLSEKDQKLISYLANHNHWTPFSHVQITLREKVPIFVARQRFKHMIGFSYNEVSRRYVNDAPEFFIPGTWRKKAENKKQGSSDEEVTELNFGEVGQPISQAYEDLIAFCSETYETMIKNGVAPEQARMVLPQSMYTEYYTTGSLAAWARAYKLRIDAHAQREIQELAEKWNEIISSIEEVKYSWQALTM